MTTTTIAQLPQAATPLVGTEIIPLDQSGITCQTPISAIASAVPLRITVFNSSFSAQAGLSYALNTANGAITVTLPSVASAIPGGLSIALFDISRDANTNHVTITATGSDQIILVTTTTTSQTLSVNGFIAYLIPIQPALWRCMLVASA